MAAGAVARPAARRAAMERVASALLLLVAAPEVDAHGTLNLPESRNGAQAGLGLRQGGRTQPYCVAYWFTDNTHMVGNATIADDACSLLTCFQCSKQGCAGSRLARAPWRAPGTSILSGGPCGTIGSDGSAGRNTSITRGTDLPHNFPYMPKGTQAPTWKIGGVERVAWGLAVNHGGGVSISPIGADVLPRAVNCIPAEKALLPPRVPPHISLCVENAAVLLSSLSAGTLRSLDGGVLPATPTGVRGQHDRHRGCRGRSAPHYPRVPN